MQKNIFKPFGYAILFFLLFLGLSEQVKMVVDNVILPMFSITQHWALDLVLVIITVVLLCQYVKVIKEQKYITATFTAVICFLIACYACYRWDESVYVFTRCWCCSFVAYLDVFALLGILYIGYWLFKTLFIKANNNGGNSAYSFKILPPSQDAPIKKIDDDKFGMQEHVNNVVSYLSLVDVSEKAFSIGVVGNWGYGKSSFFNFIKNEIKEKEEFIVMDFNPRSSKDLNCIQEDFLNGLRESLQPFHPNLIRIFEDYAHALNISTNTSPIISFLLRIFSLHTKGWKESYDNIDMLIKEVKKRIVIFVDDLDRLTAKELLEVLKVIDKNGAFNYVIFVSAYDKDYVNNALKAYLRHDVKCPYTDKYFDLEIELPKHAFHLLMDYLKDLLLEACAAEQMKVPQNELKESIQDVEGCLRSRLHTIRDVKRFANQFLYNYPAVQTEVNFRDYFLLELMKFSHKGEYDKLREAEYLDVYKITNEDGEQYFLSSLLYVDKKHEIDSLDILEKLFPENINNPFDTSPGRICNTNSFDIYFYNNEYNHILQNDFDSLYTLSLVECCDKLDSWIENTQSNSPHNIDIKNYMTSRHLSTMGDVNRLKILFQLLSYLQSKSEATGYWMKLREFFQKEEAKRNIIQYGFEDKREYLNWMKEAMEELFYMKMDVSTYILPKMIEDVLRDKTLDESLIFDCHELQHAALSFLKGYLQKLDTPDWDAKMAFTLSAIHGKEEGRFHLSTMKCLRTAMETRPEKFYTALLPVVTDKDTKSDGWKCLDYDSNFHLLEVFPDFDNFQKLFDKESTEEYVEILWKFSQLYGKNDFNPLVIKTSFNSKTEIIHQTYEKLSELEFLSSELKLAHFGWENIKKLRDIDACLREYKAIELAVKNVDLDIQYKDKILNNILLYTSQISEQNEKIRTFSDKNMVVGDFVKLKNECLHDFQEQNVSAIDLNICKLEEILPDGLLKLDIYNGMIPMNAVEAIPINGIDDKSIYYDPVIAAATVDVNAPIPVHYTDKSYYLEHFKRCYVYDAKSFHDIVKEKEFEFVHEVQHWLRNEVGEDLKVNRFDVFRRRFRTKRTQGSK